MDKQRKLSLASIINNLPQIDRTALRPDKSRKSRPPALVAHLRVDVLMDRRSLFASDHLCFALKQFTWGRYVLALGRLAWLNLMRMSMVTVQVIKIRFRETWRKTRSDYAAGIFTRVMPGSERVQVILL